MNVYEIWEQLGNVPVNNEGELETDFLHFSEGDEILEVWSWIEEKFEVSVYDLLHKTT